MVSILLGDLFASALEMISSPLNLPPTFFNDSRVTSVISKVLPSLVLEVVALMLAVTATSIVLVVVITRKVPEVLVLLMIPMLLG